MLYLIGLGLNEKGISIEGREILQKCEKFYLESYTVEFPYPVGAIEKIIGKKIVKLGRNDVESDNLIKEAKTGDIALLIYGSPLFATTHISLLMEAEKAKIKTKVIYSASIFDAVAETGLQLYKFGKVSSLSKWGKNFEPDSFLNIVIQNQSIGAHSLILVDIGLELDKAILELETSFKRKNLNVGKLVVCSNLGTIKGKIYYNSLEDLKKKKITSPYCFIVTGEMHFLEREALERFA